MWLKIFICFIVALGIFLTYVATRDGKFRYEAKGIIEAPATQVFPYISDLRLGVKWVAFMTVDPNIKSEFIGVSNEVGSRQVFRGNKDAGAGELEIIEIKAPHYVQIKLTMMEPMRAVNKIEYFLKEVGAKSELTWVMSGESGFAGKLAGMFFNIEKMILEKFHEGIQNLNAIVTEDRVVTGDIWLNLSSKNLERSKEFYEEMGFEINKENPGNHVSMFVGKNRLVVNLFDEKFLETVMNQKITNTESSNEVLLSLGANSREEVDEMIERARKAGAKIFSEPSEKDGWLYGAGFSDPDGHRWNFLYMDLKKLPKEFGERK